MQNDFWTDALNEQERILRQEIHEIELFAPKSPRLLILQKQLRDLNGLGADCNPPADNKACALQPNEWVCPACRTKNDYFINDFCKFCGQSGPMAIMGS